MRAWYALTVTVLTLVFMTMVYSATAQSTTTSAKTSYQVTLRVIRLEWLHKMPKDGKFPQQWSYFNQHVQLKDDVSDSIFLKALTAKNKQFRIIPINKRVVLRLDEEETWKAPDDLSEYTFAIKILHREGEEAKEAARMAGKLQLPPNRVGVWLRHATRNRKYIPEKGPLVTFDNKQFLAVDLNKTVHLAGTVSFTYGIPSGHRFFPQDIIFIGVQEIKK